jgi:hypothetical protein
MDETKRVPPKPPDSEKSPQSSPSSAPGTEAMAMIQRTALAMADRRRLRRSPEQSANNPPAQTSPLPEVPEPFFAPKFEHTVTSIPVPPRSNQATDASEQAKLIAEFDSLLSGRQSDQPAPTRTAPASTMQPATETRTTGPIGATTDPLKTQTKLTASAAAAALRPLFDDQFRLSLTRWQSAGAAVAIVALAISACGLATHTWMTAHDWSCRTGLATKYCPSSAPVIKPTPVRPTPDFPT